MTYTKLYKVLEDHYKWLKDPSAGKHADLSCVNLSGANLSGYSLSNVNLTGANLTHADLSYANLSHANLAHTDLSYANLSGANLYSTNLSDAILSGADLSEVVISSNTVILRSQVPQTIVAPLTGSFEGWKKVYGSHAALYRIVHLAIPAEARRSNAMTRKCRAEFADVLGLYDTEGTLLPLSESTAPLSERCIGRSAWDDTVFYRKGFRVTADAWDDDWRNECSHGIHFFMTREEAEEYTLI